MIRKGMLVLAGIAAAGAVAMLAGGVLAWAELNRPYAGWVGEEGDTAVVVILENGEPAGTMIRRLADAGVIHSPGLTRLWARLSGEADSLQAGEYRFHRPVSPREVLDMLRSGRVLLHAVTVPEGLSLVETASRLGEQTGLPMEGFVEVMSDPGPLAAIDPRAGDLEGYLFPDTYHFPRTATAEEVVGAMVRRFLEVVGPGFPGPEVENGLDLRQVVTLASLIEKETSVHGERSRISRVFHNRLNRGMKLQCDPTVIYALRRDGRDVGKLTYRDLEYPSPWNTYHAYGLPPGPIASPGLESLQAAVQPAPGNELYFVASPGGGHQFTVRLEDHLKAVREYRAWMRSRQ